MSTVTESNADPAAIPQCYRKAIEAQDTESGYQQ